MFDFLYVARLMAFCGTQMRLQIVDTTLTLLVVYWRYIHFHGQRGHCDSLSLASMRKTDTFPLCIQQALDWNVVDLYALVTLSSLIQRVVLNRILPSTGPQEGGTTEVAPNHFLISFILFCA